MSIRCNSRFAALAGLISRRTLAARLAPFALITAAATLNCGDGALDFDVASTQGALATSDEGSSRSRLSAGWTEQSMLTADPLRNGGEFGTSVAMTGNILVVGAAGALADDVYVFSRTGSTWTSSAHLEHTEAPGLADFGRSVAISEDGNTIAVGAPYWHHPYESYGAVYIYVRSGSTFTKQQILLPPSDATPSFGSFGSSVALSRNTLVVGDPGSSPLGLDHAGATHVYVRSETAWTRQARLLASDRTNAGSFGRSVAISADTLLVAASSSDTPGRAYVFTRSGNTWTQRTKLVPSGAGDQSIESVALSGQTAVAGESGLDGGAYVFVGSGASWSQQAKLVGSDTVPTDSFGGSVAISGNTVVVGARNADPARLTDAGAAYIFVRSGTSWAQKAQFVSSDILPEHSYFGSAVAISGNTVAVGASGASPDEVGAAGEAFVFTSTSR